MYLDCNIVEYTLNHNIIQHFIYNIHAITLHIYSVDIRCKSCITAAKNRAVLLCILYLSTTLKYNIYNMYNICPIVAYNGLLSY